MNKGLSGSQDRVAFEALEPRLLLDGNVTVKVTKGGDLKVTGDGAANDIWIDQGADPSQFVIRGDAGTTVNGQAQVTVDGVRDDIIVNLKGGNDELTVWALTVPDMLKVKTGSGDDVIGVYHTTVQGRTVILTRSGNDEVNFSSSHLEGRCNVTTHGGADDVSFYKSSTYRLVNVKTGGGEDEVWLGHSAEFGAKVKVKTGAGKDNVWLSDSTFWGPCVVSMGGAFDWLTGSDSTLHAKLKATLGGGGDTVYWGTCNTVVGGKIGVPLTLKSFMWIDAL